MVLSRCRRRVSRFHLGVFGDIVVVVFTPVVGEYSGPGSVDGVIGEVGWGGPTGSVCVVGVWVVPHAGFALPVVHGVILSGRVGVEKDTNSRVLDFRLLLGDRVRRKRKWYRSHFLL